MKIVPRDAVILFLVILFNPLKDPLRKDARASEKRSLWLIRLRFASADFPYSAHGDRDSRKHNGARNQSNYRKCEKHAGYV